MSLPALIAEGANILFTPTNILVLFVSIVLGIIAGSLPGLSSSNTAAVMLPLTLGMKTDTALIFIMGIYVGAQYGGSIPAILLRTPGTTGAGATTLDGYPLSQQGKADLGLGLALGASTVGGLIAAIITIFIISPISSIALTFRSPEIFLLAILGLSIIATVTGKHLMRGFLSGFVGLLIGAMASDPNLGLPRLYLGFYEMYDEFPLIPPLIGLFSFPALFDLVGKGRVIQGDIKKIGTFRAVLTGVGYTIRRPVLLIRSSLIGLFVGIIPAAGIDVASYLSYSQAQVWSDSPKTFGKGNPDGVIAPEAANNACTSGALVPSMALGVPGSATTAVLLAALVLHGIRPGPFVIRDNQGMVYAVFLSVLVGHLVMFVAGLVYTRFAARVTMIPTVYLLPATLSICLIGAFAVRYTLFDVYILIIFGLVGFVMTKNDYPFVPLILGLVMGPMAENNFVRSMALSRGSLSILFESPLSKVLWAIILGSIVAAKLLPLLRRPKQT